MLRTAAMRRAARVLHCWRGLAVEPVVLYSRFRRLRKRIIKKWYHAIRDLALRNGTMRLGAPIS